MKGIVLVILLIITTQIYAGPFGLEWGQSLNSVKSNGVSCTMSTQGSFQLCETNSLPKNLSIAESYTLVFDKKYKLQKVLMVSEDITNDPYGTEGKQIYNKFKNTLTSKYGKPTDGIEVIGLSLYDEADEFYECLKYAGCGGYLAYYLNGGEAVSITLKGLSRGKGYISINYEGPQWGAAIDSIKDKESKADDDAL